MPTYKNVSDAPIDWISTGHMEPGEIKIIADHIQHEALQLVDDNELATTVTGTEPEIIQAPVAAQLEQPVAAPVAPAEPVVPQAPDQPVPPTVIETQGA